MKYEAASSGPIVVWSPKGGSGVSTVAALLAVEISRRFESANPDVEPGCRLIDLCGDQEAIFGVPDKSVGVRQWTAKTSSEIEALWRVVVPVATNLSVVPAGAFVGDFDKAAALRRLLARPEDVANCVIDAGTLPPDFGDDLLCASPVRSIAVVRGCYLTARRAVAMSYKPDGFVFIEESGRVLIADDIADVWGVPALASVKWDADIARTVDSGRMAYRRVRVPRGLRDLATQVLAGVG